MMEPTLSLYELNMLVRETLEATMPTEYWVEAELSEVRESRGHCYMELVQFQDNSLSSQQATSDSLFSTTSRTPIARASAKCWRNTWMLVRPHFERITGQQLHSGLKVMLKVYAQFHETYGFSWIVTDINPEFTMGDMQRKRQEIIRQLKTEGVFDLQKELCLPLFAQRIAVISSATAAGYEDFCNQLTNNEYGFVFHTELFAAIMQGEETEQSVIAALDRINNQIDDYDVVVIIRGGGATADLSGFDTLALAENVANFPLPIITGIGHERDESILDMISHTRVKTPTAAASFLISHLKEILDTIEEIQQRITHFTQQKLATLNTQLSYLQETLPRLFSNIKARHEARIDALYNRAIHHAQLRLSATHTHLATLQARLPMIIEKRMLSEQHKIAFLEEKAKNLDPALQLKRGYSITLKDGKAIRDASSLKAEDIIETHFAEGIIHSKVIK